MIYYANPCTEAVRDAMSAGRLGCITTPYQGNVTFPGDGWDVIADNGCFSGNWSAEHRFSWLLDQPRSMRFAVCPDVFDPTGAPCHEATLHRWELLSGRIKRAGFRAAFVGQVGAQPDNVPWEMDALFLGGTTAWKLSAHRLVAEANRRGVWVHMGRVNSRRRLFAARAMGCDSADGTYLTFGPDVNLPRLLSWVDEANRVPMLWEAS